MAATADPRAKPPAAPPRHLEPWARRQPPAAAHRMPVLPVVAPPAGAACAALDRRRPSYHRRGGAAQDVGGIEELRAKLMGHLRDAADRLRLRVPQPSPSPPPPPKKTASPPPETDAEPELGAPPPSQEQQPQADVATTRPWNLRERTRRPTKSWAASAQQAPPSSSPPSRRRRKRAPFSVSLTAEEVEEDLYSLTGARPRRRPRKRPRVVQRQLDTLFPGLWLTEVTADAYRVPDD